jgi:hypothetical protein
LLPVLGGGGSVTGAPRSVAVVELRIWNVADERDLRPGASVEF